MSASGTNPPPEGTLAFVMDYREGVLSGLDTATVFYVEPSYQGYDYLIVAAVKAEGPYTNHTLILGATSLHGEPVAALGYYRERGDVVALGLLSYQYWYALRSHACFPNRAVLPDSGLQPVPQGLLAQIGWPTPETGGPP